MEKLFKNSLGTICVFLVATFLFGCGGGNVSIIPATDSFTQEGQEITAKMDILWVIDNSGSMNNFQEAVENNLLSFMENFSNKGFDFQIAVTVSDGYRDMNFSNYVANGGPTFNSSNFSRFKPSSDGSRVLSSVEDPAVLLTKFEQIIAAVGTSGSGDERVMQSFQAAMLNPNNVADGFFREDAHLAIILVSDEEDTSWRQSNYITNASGCSGPYSNGYMNAGCASQVEDVSYFESFLINNSSDVYGATVHNMAISPGDVAPPGSTEPGTGNPSTDCRTAILPGDSSAYARYFGERTNLLSDLTGGTKSSLCGDFAASLNNIAQTIIERSVEFTLENTPSDPNLIVVEIKNVGDPDFTTIPQDGTNGWSYNASANSIVFHGTAIPSQGAEINVSFDPDSL